MRFRRPLCRPNGPYCSIVYAIIKYNKKISVEIYALIKAVGIQMYEYKLLEEKLWEKLLPLVESES